MLNDRSHSFLWYRWSAVVEGVHAMMAGFLRHKHYASRQPSSPPMSRMEHILREVWRFVWYIGLGFREFFLLQQVYFASCSVGLASDGEDPWEVRFRRWRTEVRQHPSVPGLPCQPPKESNQQQNRRSKLDYIYAPGEPGLLLFPVLVQPSLPYALIKRRILIGSGYFVGGCGRLVYGRLVYGQFHSGKHLKPSFGKHPQYPLSESHG